MTTISLPPAPPIRVDTASAANHAAIRRLLAAAYLEYAEVMPGAVFARYVAELADLDQRRGGEVLVATVGRDVVGTATYYADAAEEELGWPSGWAGVRAMGVDPAYRGLGIARRLINECIARAAEAGASTFCLHTAAFMPAAIRLYEGLGFVRAPEYDFDGGVHFRSGDVAVPVIAYTRPVARAQASSGRSRRSSLTAR